MATRIYTYPRVNVNKTLVEKRNTTPYKEDTTVLFVPLITEKGPANEIVKIYSLAEFTSTFGELSYESHGQAALNIANWLTSGGTVYVFRIVSDDTKAVYKGNIIDDGKTYEAEIRAKYAGAAYNDFAFEITQNKDNPLLYSLVVRLDSKEVERYKDYTISKLVAAVNKNSDYIQITSVDSNVHFPTTFEIDTEAPAETATPYELIKAFWTGGSDVEISAASYLENKLETPIDTVLDAGYPYDIKKDIATFISEKRPDIIGIFDSYTCEYDLTKNIYKKEKTLSLKKFDVTTTTDEKTGATTTTKQFSDATFEQSEVFGSNSTNIAVYEQYFVIEDNNEDIAVTPTYFLAKLLPYNDKTYGRQWATAGLRRGILTGVKSISKNPTPNDKQDWFESRINYAEKTSREIAFMSQRTYDGSSEDSFTALSFLNNSRVTAKLIKDLERLGREYLFEFNDAITLSQMSSVLNKYLSEWIANRTLSMASVDVAPSPNSENAVDITLYIRFTGTIEVITIDITIE